MSIVRVGLAETDRYGDGWSAIFRKSSGSAKKDSPTSKKAKPAKASGKKRKK